MCLENTLLEKCIRYAVLTGYGPVRLLVMGYYMKTVSDSHSSIWNRIFLARRAAVYLPLFK